MFIAFEYDPESLQRLDADMKALAEELGKGFPEGMKKAAGVYSASIDQQFLTHGHGDWAPLAPLTVRLRRIWSAHTGKKPVAGDFAQLRVTDALREASISTSISDATKGSAFRIDGGSSMQIGVDLTIRPEAKDLQEGNEDKHIPPREFIVARPEDDDKVIDIFRDEVGSFADRFNNGGW